MSALWICDVNGVLVDTSAIIRDAFTDTAAHFGFPLTEPAFHRVKGLWLAEAYRLLQPGRDPLVLRQYHLRRVRERLPAVRASPGVAEVLVRARASQIQVAAATSHGEFAEACLVHTGLYPLIDCLVTQEEVKRPKPHPDAILQIMDLFGVDARSDDAAAPIYIGDTQTDIVAGRAARVRTVGVTYGLSSEMEIRNAQPDYVIHAFDEMRSFLAVSQVGIPFVSGVHGR